MFEVFNIGDRVVTLISFKDVKIGTVATLEKILPNDIGIIRHDVDPESSQDKLIGIPLDSLRKATLNEVTRVKNKDRLLNKHFRVGQSWRANKNFKLECMDDDDNKVTIVGHKLGVNFASDFYIVHGTDVNKMCTISRDTLINHFVFWNKDLEESLGNELGDNGKMLDLRVGKRVKVKELVVGNDIIIGLDDVALIMEIDDVFGKVKLGINNVYTEEEVFVHTNLTNVYPATEEDIKAVDYRTIVDKKLWIGKKMVTRDVIKNVYYLKSVFDPGQMITIDQIKELGTYVLEDKFYVKNGLNDDWLELTAYDLHSYFSPQESEEIYTMEVVESATPIVQEDEIVVHELTVNGFRFSIANDQITTNESISFGEIDSFIDSLKKAVNFVTD